MKKSFVLLCGLLLALSAGCSNSTSISAETPSGSTIQSETESPSLNPSPVQESAIPEIVFETTVDEVIDVLTINVENSANVLPSDVTPEIVAWDASGATVSGSYYSYEIHDGFTVNLIDSAQSGKLQSISVIASANDLTTEAASDLGRYEAVLVAMFEPDSTKLEQIDSSLNIANASFSEDNIYMATGTIAQYMYVITDGVAMLTIDPL